MSSKLQEAGQASTVKLSNPPVTGGSIADTDRAKKVPTNRERFLAGEPFTYKGYTYRLVGGSRIEVEVGSSGRLEYVGAVETVGTESFDCFTYWFGKMVAIRLPYATMNFYDPTK